MIRPLLFSLLIAAVCVSSSAAQDEPYLLTNVRILDVGTGDLSEPQKILIADGRIAGIEVAFDNEGMLRAIDCGGRIVMPGLIDLHSHLLLHPYDEASWNEQVLNESLELRTIRGTVAARKTIEAGFTTLRDLGTEGAAFADVALRDAIAEGLIPGPRVFAVTKALVTTGGYGPMGFDPRWKMPVGAQTADGEAECRRVTREQIAAGADWIKVYADYRRRPGDPSTPTFSQEELNAIVAEATSAGVPVSAHATTDEGIKRSVLAGVKTIEHGYNASRETLQLMKDNSVVLCPTLMASESIARYSGWNPETDPDHPRVTTAKTLMRNALDVGVAIACGSDVGVFTHGDNSRELELMFAYGMPAGDVVRSATSLAASVLQQDDLGEIKTDFVADLILVDDNPIENIETLRAPLLVIKDGQVALNKLDDSGATITDYPQSAAPTPDQEQPLFVLTANGDFTHNGESIGREALEKLLRERLEQGQLAITFATQRLVRYRELDQIKLWLQGLGYDNLQITVIIE